MLGISHLIDGYQPRIQFIQGYTILLTKLAGLKKIIIIKLKKDHRILIQHLTNIIKGITGLSAHSSRCAKYVESGFLVQTHEDQLFGILEGTSEMDSKTVWGF